MAHLYTGLGMTAGMSVDRSRGRRPVGSLRDGAVKIFSCSRLEVGGTLHKRHPTLRATVPAAVEQ